jgi:hypothetical protein
LEPLFVTPYFCVSFCRIDKSLIFLVLFGILLIFEKNTGGRVILTVRPNRSCNVFDLLDQTSCLVERLYNKFNHSVKRVVRPNGDQATPMQSVCDMTAKSAHQH